jgi:hypothetical protein
VRKPDELGCGGCVCVEVAEEEELHCVAQELRDSSEPGVPGQEGRLGAGPGGLGNLIVWAGCLGAGLGLRKAGLAEASVIWVFGLEPALPAAPGGGI